MKLYQKIVLSAYGLTLALFGLYSYALVDPNLTLVNSSIWAQFRDLMVQFGYYQRPTSSFVYIVFVVLLFVFHLYFLKHYKNTSLRTLTLLTVILGIISYPFLSHDFFNYLFDAKIATFYHKNPYFFKGLDFPGDPWLRFMHWTHRTYPYGPTFLLLTLIPSFLGMGKFVLHFFFFKIFFAGFYALGVYLLSKFDKKWAVFFATSPLVIVEGLVSSHNDLIALNLAIAGIYAIHQKKKVLSAISFLFSVGIKYISLPTLLLFPKNKKFHLLALLGTLAVLLYLTFRMEIQPWYFLILLVFLPSFGNYLSILQLFFAGLLFSYYPYVRFGGWDESWKVDMKHEIIAAFFILNILYYFISRYYENRNKKN